MTTWTRQQIQQARGLRSEAAVSPEVIARARFDVLTEVRRRLASEITRYAHPFVIEIHPGDLRFREVPGDEAWEPVMVRCWWEPQTNEIELRGGERDGEVLAVHDAPYGPVMVQPSTALVLADDLTEVLPLPRPLRYECTGWSEDERRWVYEVQ